MEWFFRKRGGNEGEEIEMGNLRDDHSSSSLLQLPLSTDEVEDVSFLEERQSMIFLYHYLRCSDRIKIVSEWAKREKNIWWMTRTPPWVRL